MELQESIQNTLSKSKCDSPALWALDLALGCNSYYSITTQMNMIISNPMKSLLTVSKAQKEIQASTKAGRLAMGLTQAGLATRAGVNLPTLRKFEQKGQISLESFLKLLMVLDRLEAVVNALEPSEQVFSSIDDVLNSDKKPKPKRGWRT